MLTNRKLVLMGAALAAVPTVSKAATIAYDYSGITISTSLNGTYTAPGAALTGTATAETLTIPVGDYVRYGLSAKATGADINGGGISTFGVGITDSNANSATTYTTSTTPLTPLTLTVVPGTTYSFASQKGEYDGSGGVSVTNGGTIYGAFNAQGNATPAQGANGAGVFSPLFTRSVIYAGAAGTSVFTPVQNSTQVTFITQAPNTQSSAAYTTRIFNPVSDTIAAYPTLTIVTTGGAPTSHQPIISLTSSTPSTYGSQLGHAISITGGNGSYTTGNTGQVADPGQTTAYTAVSTFSNPATDKEIYALKLDQGGTGIATTNTTLLAAIVADINSQSTTNPGNTGNVVASLVTGVYTSLFPGYDVLLTAAAGPGATPYLGVDFSADTTDAGVTVTEIAAVPEPTTVGLVLGAAGLLLGRRKNRVTVA